MFVFLVLLSHVACGFCLCEAGGGGGGGEEEEEEEGEEEEKEEVAAEKRWTRVGIGCLLEM